MLIVIIKSNSLLMCRTWIKLATIASVTNSRGSAFSVDSHGAAGTRCLIKRRRCIDLLSLSSSDASIHSERDTVECTVFEWESQSDTLNNHGFTAQLFASSNCWGCRPFLFRGAFDPTLLLCRGQEETANVEEYDTFAWPSWENVVEIATDIDSESR